MALKYSSTSRTNRMSQLNTDIGTNAILRVYSGTRPANVAASITGTLLATFTCHSSGFGVASSGALTANAIANVTATGAGNASHFRLFRSDGTTAVIDGDVAASGSDLNLDNINIAVGQTVSITSFVITAAGA